MTVLHCQYHATTQHCLSRIRSIYSRNKQVCFLMNFTTPPNCTSVIFSRQTTDNGPPATYTYSTPDACCKQSSWWKCRQGESMCVGLYVFASQLHCIQKCCSFFLLLTCQVLLHLADLSNMEVLFIFYYHSSYYHYCSRRCLARGRELLKACQLL